MPALKLDLLQTLALAAFVYFIGLQLRKRIAIIDTLNIPAAVVGGLLFALVVLAGRPWFTLQLDTTAQSVFNVGFFTTIGMGASLAVLRAGGVPVIVFFVMATVFCFVQNFLGWGIAAALGHNPLLGVIAGSVTLVGGPATGLAFAPAFEEAGLVGAGTVAVASAMFGIICGGLFGGPVGTRLIQRHSLEPARVSAAEARAELSDTASPLLVDVEREDTPVVRNMIVLAVAMGLGSIVSTLIAGTGVSLPAYIGAMIVASVFRNIDDATGWFGIDQQAMEFVGNIALNVFLVVALMNLQLWQLAGLALPLVLILVAQIAVIAIFAYTVSFWVMGRDYDSAVMSSGFIGFVMGTTANAVANMRALVAKFGPAPKAFLIVPLVGAFFIDFTNALVITLFLNWLK